MPNLVALKRISIKNNPQINESMIQEFIFNNPSVLGLGDLEPIQREKKQAAGGRLDVLLADDNNTRYQVEIQLGATDPSHIIRTIEYWDNEKKRYPQYDHCAVIVAEEITGRFMNVISLFNGSIPLIALQLSAYEQNDGFSLGFTKVIDRVTLGNDDEEPSVVTDRSYWETRSTPKMLKCVDGVFAELNTFANKYELKYNKLYIGVAKEGIANNFIYFKPKKNNIQLFTKSDDNGAQLEQLDGAGLDVSWIARSKCYRIRLNGIEDYKKHKEQIDSLVQDAIRYFNIENE